MATTNKAIIEAYKAANNIPLTAPLYTYAAWMAQGYRVRKGEASRHRVQMWKYTPGKKTADTETQKVPQGKENKCFMKTVYLFEAGQVEKMV